MFTAKILLLGSGELGKEFVIAAKRLGCEVIACDSYANAPAMQVADAAEVFSMLDADALRAAIAKHTPDFIVPEVEAIRTEVLHEFEDAGLTVVPSARAATMTMNRDRIREVAAVELGLRTSKYRYAESLEEVIAGAEHTGLPCVIKPVMSSSGKGQSTVRTAEELEAAWTYAVANMRGDRRKVIVEEFVPFEYEITLLTVRTREGILFCEPIGHRQERGDYQESWQPVPMPAALLDDAKDMAAKVVDNLGGYGIFGVEFFVTKDEVVFSELSPRPHDTGMVTLLSQNLSEFDLHARAILGLPIPAIHVRGPAASAVILADREAERFAIEGLADAMRVGSAEHDVDVRLFGKPTTRKNRRMGVALAAGTDTDDARERALKAASAVSIRYE
ncbi:formate-dependent phosphoribosylglycinamide formyltransferase [Azospirillum brasilense]|uniref:Formate-dependent phosphoribosylglycinamide formyltransferase n=1 Tax=Azospirillum brasilense TaxID=192 RepID=A0A0P0FFA8_AZOBR|nr:MULTISPECIES: formate-dependent phosphoribosylglycinamide formyltransferase [Azospirillum]ALJ38968.1 phosphoribosylglycinamide formyltransferase [Azospirillum brasilense]MDW7557819.1 formate-dependent phosphoribosylglycinamide formyltransferase [Azospirillum brasilense]MDW7596331.1 formate-dependent phosphoribosylglycinamide formyltransferase [Azospirillum brasilense]MDW7631788.1 formate-dependent phosphoribosylglycinamide formyltransferase [Azospirillum brasilense]MDX5950628.1 formate-depe